MSGAISTTVGEIINDALHANGKLQLGVLPNGQQYADGLRRLNDMVNLWQTQGLKLFAQRELTLPVTVGKVSYSLGPSPSDVVMVKPLRILSGYVEDLGGTRRLLTGVSRDEWQSLPQNTGESTAVNFFCEKQVSQLVLHLWPAPNISDANSIFKFLCQYQITEAISLQDDIDFPREWRLALVWGLADELALGQPDAVMARCEARAMTYRKALQDWDVEDTPTSFAPDLRGGSVRGFI